MRCCHSPQHTRQQGMRREGKGELAGHEASGRSDRQGGREWSDISRHGEETGGNNQESLIPTLTKGAPWAGHVLSMEG